MTNRPKGKLFALLAIFVAIGLVTATGAFTSVEAQRTATINVAGDDSAFVQLNPINYATVGADGELTIDLTESSQGAQGVNPDANSTFGSIFNVTNNGDVSIQLDIQVTDQTNVPSGMTVQLYNASSGTTVTTFSEDLASGGTSSDIGIHISADDTVTPTSDFTVTITVQADQTDGFQ